MHKSKKQELQETLCQEVARVNCRTLRAIELISEIAAKPNQKRVGEFNLGELRLALGFLQTLTEL